MATEIIEPKNNIFLPFGITRLDQELEGIPSQDFCLVCGGTHTGKSVFAFNFLLNGLRNKETVALVASIPPEQVLEQADALQLPIRDYVETGDLILLYQKTQHPHLIHNKEDLSAVISALEEELLPWEPSRLVFDSFVPFISLFHPDFRKSGLQAAFRRLRRLELSVMLTTRMPRSSEALNMRRLVEERSACYFHLDEHRPPKGDPTRRLVVRKMQGLQPPYPVYNFVIEKGVGLKIYEKTDTPLEKPDKNSGAEAAHIKEKEPRKTQPRKSAVDFRDNKALMERLDEEEMQETELKTEESLPDNHNKLSFLAEKDKLDSDRSTEKDVSFADLAADTEVVEPEVEIEEENEKLPDNSVDKPPTQPNEADRPAKRKYNISFSEHSFDLSDAPVIPDHKSDVIKTDDAEPEPLPTTDERYVTLTTDNDEFERTPPESEPRPEMPPAKTDSLESFSSRGKEFEEQKRPEEPDGIAKTTIERQDGIFNTVLDVSGEKKRKTEHNEEKEGEPMPEHPDSKRGGISFRSEEDEYELDFEDIITRSEDMLELDEPEEKTGKKAGTGSIEFRRQIDLNTKSELETFVDKSEYEKELLASFSIKDDQTLLLGRRHELDSDIETDPAVFLPQPAIENSELVTHSANPKEHEVHIPFWGFEEDFQPMFRDEHRQRREDKYVSNITGLSATPKRKG